MVTFTETTQVSPVGLREPPCLTATLSPGLRRKKMLWQNAVKHIIIQQELSAQVTGRHALRRFDLLFVGFCFFLFFCTYSWRHGDVVVSTVASQLGGSWFESTWSHRKM